MSTAVYQGSNGKWYYPGNSTPYDTQFAAEYLGHRDSIYQMPSTTDPVTGQVTTGYGTNVKEAPQTGLSYSDYGINPATGTQTEEKAKAVKEAQLINPAEQIWEKERAQPTEKEISERGIRKINGKLVSTFAERKKAYKKQREEGQAQYEYEQYLKYGSLLGKQRYVNPYSGENPYFPLLASEAQARDIKQRAQTFQEVGEGGQTFLAPRGVRLKEEIQIRKGQTAQLALEYKMGLRGNPQISEEAYRPAKNLGTTTIQTSPYLKVGDKLPENAGSISQKIERQALEAGAESIQIYNAQGEPVGGIAAKGSAPILENLLTGTSGFSYRFATPREKYVRPKETVKFNQYLSDLEKKGAIIDIVNKEGKVVGTTGGQRARYDIIRATEKEGEVSISPRYSFETQFKSYAEAPNVGFGVANIGGYKFAYTDPFEAGAGIVENLSLEAARVGGMLGSGFVKETTRIFTGKETDYEIANKTSAFVKEHQKETGLDIITSGQPNTRSKAFLATSLGLDIGTMLIPLKTPKVPFTSLARIGEKNVVSVSIGQRITPLFTYEEKFRETGKVVRTGAIYQRELKPAGYHVSKGFDITSIGKGGFKEIAERSVAKSGRGAEIDVLGIPETKIITKESNIAKLEKAKIISTESAQMLRAGKVGVAETKNLSNKPFRTLGEQPYKNIPAGKPTEAHKEFFKKQKIVLEGSSIDIVTLEEQFVGQAGDFDVKVKNATEATNLGKKYIEKLNPTLKEHGLEFRPNITKGGSFKVELYQEVRTTAGEKKFKHIGKAGEFLSEQDPEAAGQLNKTNRVLGVKTDKGTIKVEGIKLKTRKFQLHRRTAEFTSLQPTKEGIEITTSEHRVKDLPKGYASYVTAANLQAKAGRKESARKLLAAAETIKTIGSKKIDFEKFFEERRIKPETIHHVVKPSETEGRAISRIPTRSLISQTSTPIQISPATTIPPSKLEKEKSPLPKEAVAPKGSPISKGISKVNKSYGYSLIEKPSSKLSPSKSKTDIQSKLSRTTSPMRKTYSRVSTVSPTVRGKYSSLISKPSKSTITSSLSKVGKSRVSQIAKSQITQKPRPSPIKPISPIKSPITIKSPAKPISPVRPIRNPPKKPPVPSIITTTRRREPPIIPILPTRIMTKRNKPTKGKPKYNFLGNVPVSEITGTFKRPDIIYGTKRTSKLVRADIQKSKRGNFLSRSKSISLSSKKQSHLFTKNPKIKTKKSKYTL